MGLIKTLGRYAWRKFALDGVSSSGFHKPEHPDIFAFVDKVDEDVATINTSLSNIAEQIETIETGNAEGIIFATTLADLNARATALGLGAGDAGRAGRVYEDSTPANNGDWRWTGSAWDFLGLDRIGQIETVTNDLATTSGDLVSRVASLSLAGGSAALSDDWSRVLFADSQGNVVAGIDRDGTLYAQSALAPGEPALLDDWWYVFVNEGGQFLYGIDANGAFVAGDSVNATFFAQEVGGVSRIYAITDGDQIAPITFGEHNATGVSVDGTDARWVEDISGTWTVKREDVTATTSIDGAMTAIELVIIYGQSQAEGGSSTPPSSTAIEYPGRSLMFNIGPRYRGTTDQNNPTPSVNIRSLVNLYEVSQESPASGQAAQIISGLSATTALLTAVAARSGTAYADLKKGTQPYANLVGALRRGRIIAGLNDLDLTANVVTFIHGYNNSTASLAAYQGYLEELQADLTADTATYTGTAGEVLLFTSQCAAWTKIPLTTSAVPVAQLAAALANPGKIFCVGPEYFLPTMADGIHWTPAASRLMGEYYGRAIRQTKAGTPWVAPYISSAIRTGADIVLTYSGGSGDIVIDTTLVAAATNNGFEWSQTGGTARTISSVTKTGARQITVTLSGDPGSPSASSIAYALTGVSGNSGGPITGARGNIRDSSPDLSTAGTPMYNWACMQSVNL